jgi:hypothetical protein
MGLFMATAGLATIYTTSASTFGPKLSLQNEIKAMKAKNERAYASSQQPSSIIRYAVS